MSAQETPVTKPKASAGRMSAENSLLKFLSCKTPESAINVLTACAASGDECWKTLLDKDLACKIADQPTLLLKLTTNLCKQPGMAHAPEILDAFLSLIPKNIVEGLFSGPDLKKRSHPAVTCFYNASFSSPSGIHLTRALAVLAKHGLPIATVATKNMGDLERAVSVGHRDFMILVIPALTILPDEVIKTAMVKSMYPVNAISILIDECNVPISALAQPRILAAAKPEARSYISARLSRIERIPEMICNDVDSMDDAYPE